MKKIAIVGAGLTASTLATKLREANIDDIEIVDSVDDLNLQRGILIDDNSKYPIINPYKDLPEMNVYGQSKPFICKGKHQYENTKGKWICQCGRNIND